MSSLPARVILGSSSPQRRELLRLLLPDADIQVLPPRNVDEAGFDGLRHWPAIERRLLEIVQVKQADIESQRGDNPEFADAPAIAADSIIVVAEEPSSLHVLGKPPADDSWPDVVRRWFREHYAGRTHWAATAINVGRPGEPARTRVVRTAVLFRNGVERWLDWYIATGEPIGKAGGYGLQGAGSIFIERVEGSLSNVVGLPLAEVAEMLEGWPGLD